MVKKPNGEYVDFDSVLPKYKTGERVMSSFANAVVDAIWDGSVLCERHLCFQVIRSGDSISKRMPPSQSVLLKRK